MMGAGAAAIVAVTAFLSGAPGTWRLPLGPTAEREVRAVLSPIVHGEALPNAPGWRLWTIGIEGKRLSLGVAPVDRALVTGTLVVELSPWEIGGEATFTPMLSDPAATVAMDALIAQLRPALRAVAPPVGVPLPVKNADPQDSDATLEAGPRGPPPPPDRSSWALFILLALGATLAFALPGIWSARGPHEGTLIPLALITGMWAFFAWVLPDTVLHLDGHAWDTARAISQGPEGPYGVVQHYGSIHLLLARALSWASRPGLEPFAASRVAGALCIPLSYLFARAVTGSPKTALLAAGLLAGQAALLFAGRAPSVTATGMAVFILAAWLCVMAGRARTLRMALAAGCALGALGSFRLLGPIIAGSVFLLAAASMRHHRARPGRSPWMVLAIIVAVSAGLAAPHLWDMGRSMAGSVGGRMTSSGPLAHATLLDSRLWTPAALTILAAVGALFLGRRNPAMAIALVIVTALGLFAALPAARTWPDNARYQLFALLPVTALAAHAFTPVRIGAAKGPLARRFAHIALLITGLAALGFGSIMPGRALAVGHPESSHLHAWREAMQTLPQGAVLALPETWEVIHGGTMPDAELRLARPDIVVLGLKDALRHPGLKDRSIWWFYPLYCHGQVFQRAPKTSEFGRSDCVRLQSSTRIAELRWAQGLNVVLPPDLLDALEASHFDLDQWRGARYLGTTVRVGLYALHPGPAGGGPKGAGATP